MNTIKINEANRAITAHLYEINAKDTNGSRVKLDVHANTRASAAKLATVAGYTVLDVNMIG